MFETFLATKTDKIKSFIKKQPPEGFSKKGVLKKFYKIHLKTPVLEKETPTQVFSGKFCEISKNTFFTEHFRNLPHGFIS